MQRLYITVLACLMSVSVVGQRSIDNLAVDLQLLVDFVETARADGFNLDITLPKFPEFYDVNTRQCRPYKCQLLVDFVETARADGFNLDITLPKFPEFYNNDIELPIIKRGNMNFILIEIGGVEYEVLIDSGASDVLLSNEIMKRLSYSGDRVDMGSIKTYTLADGSTKNFQTATLNSISINNTVFENIDVAFGETSSLLLGMSFLSRYNWQIKTNHLVLSPK